MVASAVLLGACGGDEGGGRDASIGEEADTRRDEAPDLDDVRAEVVDLLDDYDRVVNQIIADPGVAADREDPLVLEFLDLFEPGNEFAEQVIDVWVADGEEGISVRPYDDRHPANRTSIDGEIEAVSDREVRAPFCLEQRHITYRGDQVIQGLPLLERPGEVVAVRVDGEWRLHSRNVFSDRSECGGEGS